MARHYRYSFTLNNYNDEDIQSINDWDCRFLIYGKEVAASGTPHLQGYVEFFNNKSLSALKKYHKGAHFEVSKGNAEQNIKYCSKGEQSHDEFSLEGSEGPNFGKNAEVFQKGTPSMSQKRKGEASQDIWADIYGRLKRGKLESIADDYPGIYLTQYNNLLAHQNRLFKRPVDRIEPDNMWIFGKTGDGKSTYAQTNFPDAYIKNGTTKWWDGYSNEDTVILDDVGMRSYALVDDFKQWTGNVSCRVEMKGSSMLIRPKKVIVTSNYMPWQIWSEPNEWKPIMRRFKFFKMENYSLVPYGGPGAGAPGILAQEDLPQERGRPEEAEPQDSEF